MAGIQETLETIQALKELVVDAIDVSKGGITFSDLAKLFEIIGDLKDLADSAPKALPELKDLDAGEIGQISAAAYQALREIVLRIK